MNRLQYVLRIQTGEEHISALLVSLMFFASAGSAIGGNGIEALFFARFGVKQLPVMYIILGLFSFISSLAITAVMGRIPKLRLYVILPVLIAIVLVGGWLVIPLNLRWFFALMWLLMNVMKILQGLLTWGLAGAACDTRQAKRLFPLFSAGGILGAVVGGLATRPLAAWLHSENLLLIWAGAMLVLLVIGRALVSRVGNQADRSGEQRSGFRSEMQRGYQFIRRSSILRWISLSSILFAICYFSLALPFSRGAVAQFTDPDRLAGFLGLFDSLYTVAALLGSLFLANRLFARFGIMPMLLVFPVIYLGGFTILAFTASLFLAVPFLLLVTIRFAQMSYLSGIAETAWQTVFNVVPAEQRDQVRTFVNGVPSQAGTFIAGLILFVGEQALRPQQLFWVGFGAAAMLVYVIWRAGRAYGQALVDALRAGQPHVFFNEDHPFGGPRTDASAVAVALRGLEDPDTCTRRAAAEIIGHFQGPEVIQALAGALRDEDALVRTTALRGLANSRAAPALLDVATCLRDPEPEVRLQAIATLGDLAGSPLGIAAYVAQSLEDPDPHVRIQAALTLLRVAKQGGLVPHNRARGTLVDMTSDPDPQVCARAIEALGACGEDAGFSIAISALEDSRPAVRIAAVKAMASIQPTTAVETLIRHLNDPDTSVRCALAQALALAGDSAFKPLVEALNDPLYEDGALLALEYFPIREAVANIREYARTTAHTALRYHLLASAAARDLEAAQLTKQIAGSGRNVHLLIKSLEDEAERRGLNALRAVGLVTGRDKVSIAVENLRSRSAVQRANALETLEAAGEREIIRPLLVLWEAGETVPVSPPGRWLEELLDDPSPWLRACAVLAAARSQEPGIRAKLEEISCNDPDELVRAEAEKATIKDSEMETLTTLSLMERILFLQRVPLFADLPPVDLKQIAAVTSEVMFIDGQVIARQGEPGMEMYIVVSGEVRVLIASEGQPEPRQVAVRRSGDYVGETALLIQEPRMATLIADGAVRALCLKHKTFESILRERPEIGLAMLRSLSQRLREASELAAFH